MRKIPQGTNKEQPGTSKKSMAAATDDILRHRAFDNSMQPNIITTASTGNIVLANSAACKLLGYSKNELLTKSRANIFDVNEGSFKKMLKQRKAEGRSKALVTAIKKSGKLIPCEITSALFVDENGIEKAIFTIADMRQSILRQKNIDVKKEKIVTANITLAKSKQKNIDTKKEQIVSNNIFLAKSKQKNIDDKKERIIADNIVFAKSKQKNIDDKKERIVADNIVFAKSKQKNIDDKKERIVADNIVFAKSKQKNIDDKKEKIVANNIILAQSKQKNIDTRKEKIVAKNIVFAISKQIGIDAKNKKIVADNIALAKLKQKSIDTRKEKIVADNIVLAVSKQIEIDAKNKKIVAENIVLAISKQIEIDAKNKKIVADNIALVISNQKDIDTIKEKIVADNIVAAISKQIEIDAKNEKIVADNIALAKLKQKSIDTRKEKIVADNIVLAISKQIEIDAKNKKIVAENIVLAISKQIEIDAKNKKTVADNIALAISNQKNIDTIKEKIVADNIVLAISKQIEIDAKNEKIVADNIVLAKSKQKNIDTRKEKIVADNIILAQAKSDEERLDHDITAKAEYKENFKLIFNSSSDVLYDVDLVANEVIISDAYEKEFGYKITKNMTPKKDWVSHIHRDDKEAVYQDYLRMLASEETEWKYIYRFLRADNSVANILTSGIILRNADGNAYRMIGYMHDFSKQKELEERLEQESKLKEKHIAEAAEEAKEKERSDIGKELHDNVNQLLGASRLYLSMSKRGGKNSEMYLSRSSEYTLTAIEEIRKLTKRLTTDTIKNLGLCEAIDNVTRDMMEVNPVKISFALGSFKENSVNDKFKLNVFRIVQEQLNNILKHAKAKEVIISLLQNKKSITLSISDNGVGFDTGQKRKGIGVANIKSRAMSYNGTADFVSQPGAGCVLTVTFPVTNVMLNKSSMATALV